MTTVDREKYSGTLLTPGLLDVFTFVKLVTITVFQAPETGFQSTGDDRRYFVTVHLKLLSYPILESRK